MNELEKVGRRVKRRRIALNSDVELLHHLVRKARSEGVSLRGIAERSGLSFGRVHQLTKEGADADHQPHAADHD